MNAEPFSFADYLAFTERQEYLTTCPIQQLNGLRFLVPPYQRGYRWTKLQVKQLLDDINQFEPRETEFYCLQPIVVRRRPSADGNVWELIDGQQRLTTIWLLLHLLDDSQNGYSLDFETAARKSISRQTLADAVDAAPPPLALDAPLEASYIRAAATAIRTWLRDLAADKAAFRHKLLADTRVIWYETAAPDRDAQAIFSRLNAGKILLTDAELIKALLLKTRAGAPGTPASQARRLEIAADWNHLEATLGQPAFWGWLRQPANTGGRPRIEWLLGLEQKQREKTAPPAGQSRALFWVVEQELQGAEEAAWAYWQRVRQLFNLLHGWFESPDFYHRVGYLLATGSKLTEVLALQTAAAPGGPATGQPVSKTALLTRLGQCIAERAGFPDGDPDQEWDGLQYGENNELIKRILLLHNVATAWQAHSTSSRFPFDRYFAEGSWSLEHVHPQNPRDETVDDQQRWLKDLKEFLDKTPTLAGQPGEGPSWLLPDVEKALRMVADTNSENPEATSAFEQAVKTIRAAYLPYVTDFEPEQVNSDAGGANPLHALTNLALLASRDNSALGNAAFPQKRLRLLDKYYAAAFIPPATLNVFLKMHSTRASDLRRWTRADREDYQQAMRQSVRAFLKTPILAAPEKS